MPLLSVVIPVYNAADYLVEAIESLKAQTMSDFEAILIDDGSSDPSLEICQRAADADHRFRVIAIANSGPSIARNHGLDKASGRYIVFLDADDALHPYALSHWIDVAEATQADLVTSPFLHGRTFTPDRRHAFKQATVVDSKQASMMCLYQRGINFSACSKLWRTDFIGHQRFPIGQRYEDLEFTWRAITRASRVAITSDPLYFYRANPASFINRWSQSRLDVLDVTDRMTAFTDFFSPTLSRAAADRRFAAHYNMLGLMLSHSIDNPDVIARCRDVVIKLRRQVLFDRHSRMRNRLGALAAYGGLPVIKALSKIVYR